MLVCGHVNIDEIDGSTVKTSDTSICPVPGICELPNERTGNQVQICREEYGALNI